MISKKADNLEKAGTEKCLVCRDLFTNLEQFFNMLSTADKSPKPDWLSVNDIAKDLKISKSIVYRIIRNGELGAVDLVGPNGHIAQRGHYRITRSSLNQYLESKKVEPLSDKPIRITRSRQYPKVKNHLGL
ncbi:MAG: helix-turn-helix domain-containing protein [Deltaproteobacteria bacterium]|nr:helix-turn-helix domain-containing protein [Deltaproteobacteria bacterium]